MYVSGYRKLSIEEELEEAIVKHKEVMRMKMRLAVVGFLSLGRRTDDTAVVLETISETIRKLPPLEG